MVKKERERTKKWDEKDAPIIDTSLYVLDHEFDPNNAWLGLGRTDILTVPQNPLQVPLDSDFYQENPGFWEINKLRDPNYIGYAAWVFLGITLIPYQQVILKNMWNHTFPMLIASRGGGKSFCIAVYSLLKCLLYNNHKVVITSGGFRQSKMVFTEIEKLYSRAPVFQSVAGAGQGATHSNDAWVFQINDSTITSIPTGDGDKIRGMRANTIFLDEFASQDTQVVEEVILGFGAVSADPVENVKMRARKEYFESQGIVADVESERRVGNQAIFCGTASYYDNHFYNYWKKHKAIIESKGDKNKLEKIFNGDVPKRFDWKDYCVIRLPYSMLPQGYMEDTVVARAKASMAKSMYFKEYEAVFIEDSDGFFRRSVIEKCTATEQRVASDDWNSIGWCRSPFEARMKGSPDLRYVMGIDPASESDNLAIVILELHPEHQRVVHSWTTNRKNYELRKKMETTQCENYFEFVNRKVRDLMKVFNIVGIGIDMQGGGVAVYEAMHNTAHLEKDEVPMWFIVEHDNPRPCDNNSGLHIIHDIQFARYDWTVKANYDLLKDMETRALLFPRCDAITLQLSAFDDTKKYGDKLFQKNGTEIYDTYENLVMDIEHELKEELTSVQKVTSAAGNRIKWVVPAVQNPNNVKRLTSGKKDRYSALLIANYLARRLRVETNAPNYTFVAGGLLADRGRKVDKTMASYDGPDWFVSQFGV